MPSQVSDWLQPFPDPQRQFLRQPWLNPSLFDSTAIWPPLSQRDLTALMQAELRAGVVRPLIFVEAEFRSGPVRMWTGYGEISWDGKTWSGAADSEGKLIGSISPLPETSRLEAQGIILTLSGIPNDMIDLAINETRQGKPARIWLGFLDASFSVINTPYRMFRGRMDVPTVEEGAATSIITITCENLLVDGKRPRERRYTDEDQQSRFPGDRFFEYQAITQLWNGVWGKATPGVGSSSGTGGGRPETCWSPESPVVTRRNAIAISEVRPHIDWVRTKTGVWRRVAKKLVHQYDGPLLLTSSGKVTPDHRLVHADKWVPASYIYAQSIRYCGPVYNLEVEATMWDERSYEMENGIVAHNVKPRPE